MSSKKVIVIGAGMGGLSAAIKLQHHGFDVEIYEKNHQPGGKMARISKDGFQFDVGPTIVMAPQVYQQVFDHCGRDMNDYVKMHQLDPMYDVYFKDHPEYRHYHVSTDLTKLMEMMEAKGPETAQGFLEYLSAMHKRYKIALEDFMTKSFRKPTDMYNPYMIKQGLKLKTFDNAKDSLAKFIPDQDIQQMFSFQTLYIGVSPQNGPSLYNIIPLLELLYGVYYIEGGMHQMALGMEKLFKELGGKIYYDQEVTEIVTEFPEAKGILLADGSYYEADAVISNVDFPMTMSRLIKDDRVAGKYTQEKIDEMDYSCSCLIFYWGVNGEFKNLETHQFIVSEDLDLNLEQIFNGEEIDDPSIYLHIPSNIDDSVAPDGKSSFYTLLPVPELGVSHSEYDQETINRYRQKVLKTLEKISGLENIRDQIEMEMVYTPKDFKEKFGSYRGTTFGLQPSLLQSNHWRPQVVSPTTKGLYFAGSSVHPGAGVPTCILGGEQCAEELIKDFKE